LLDTQSPIQTKIYHFSHRRLTKLCQNKYATIIAHKETHHMNRRRDLLLIFLTAVLVLGLASAQSKLTLSLAAAWSPSPPVEWPVDARSTSGPLPPPDVQRWELNAPAAHDQVLLSGVPAYIWHNGCGPTAAGMVVGYWDTNGFDDLVAGNTQSQTPQVDAMISSPGNHEDYCRPIDSYPNLMPDKSEPPFGDEHPDDSLADLMKTSQSYHYNLWGWSRYSDMVPALEGYVALMAPHYTANAQNQTWGAFTWEVYTTEIDAGRPVVLLVDTDGNGHTDHFVTAMGYVEQGGKRLYACRDTWDTGIHWYEFAQMESGQPWGIYGATLFRIAGPSATTFTVFLPHVTDN
jgi:hypothetical protein